MTKNVMYVGVGRRAVALLIDMVLMVPVYVLLMALPFTPLLQEVVYLLLVVLAYAVFLASRWQATPGMRLMRVVAVDAAHEKLSQAKAAGWCAISLMAMAVVCAPVMMIEQPPAAKAITEQAVAATLNGQKAETILGNFSEEDVAAYAAYNERIRKAYPLTLLLGFAWIATVAVGKQKAGVHNWLAGVRFVPGRM